MIHRFDPAMRPDSEFEPGVLAHLVIGNRGRMLDPRRTPVRVAGLAPALGMFECEVLDFEDRGARWLLPFERIASYQFERGCPRAGSAEVEEYRAAIQRFDRPLEIPVYHESRRRTLERIATARHEADAWLEHHSTFIASGDVLDCTSRDGDPRLWRDLERWLGSRGAGAIEREFATRYVSNPHAGECVKGHRIVLAELGLAPYHGTIVRDPELFDGAWSRSLRAEHVVARCAFVQALFQRGTTAPPLLHRGIATDAPEVRTGAGFVSATFVREVAESILGPPGTPRRGVIQSRPAPLDRLFMTYLETEPMNRHFREAEAVLIEGAEPDPF